MAEQTVIWQGASGKQYTYWTADIAGPFKKEPGNYIFAKQVSQGQWTPIYIGETDNLMNRLPNHEKLPCVKRHGGTHVHAHTTPTGVSARKQEEADLLAKWDPPCNQEQ